MGSFHNLLGKYDTSYLTCRAQEVTTLNLRALMVRDFHCCQALPTAYPTGIRVETQVSVYTFDSMYIYIDKIHQMIIEHFCS